MGTEHHLCQSPIKSPLKPKKAPVITRGEYSKVRVGSYGAKKICCWLGRQIKTEKAKRQRRQKDRQRQRRQERQTGLFRDVVPRNGRRAVIVQRISCKYIKSALWIVRYLSVFNLVKRCLCQSEQFPCQSRIFSQNQYTSV